MKKLIISILTLFLFIPTLFAADFTIFKQEGGFIATGKLEGTSADAYPVTPNCRWKTAYLAGKKSLFIFNTDANGLLFKIVAYPTTQTGVDPYIVKDSLGVAQSDIALATGDVAIVNLADEVVQQIDIFIKSAVADTPSDYLCVSTGAMIR